MCKNFTIYVLDKSTIILTYYKFILKYFNRIKELLIIVKLNIFNILYKFM
jgi:hypothetical protein